MNKFIVNLFLRVLPFLIGMTVTAGINKYEYFFMPVVKDFAVLSIKDNYTNIVISGYMRKVRECNFAGITAMTKDDVSLPLVFRDSRSDTANRPQGTQQWGPWSIEIPKEVFREENTVTLTSIHQCHPFWTSQTKLITIPLQFQK